jgi:hypothetical protein
MRKVVLIIYLFLVPLLASAQPLPVIPSGEPITRDSLTAMLRNLASFLLSAGVILAVIFLVWSGITWMSAGADSAKAGKAKERFKWAVVGTLVIFSIGMILATMGAIGTGTFF